MYSFIIIIIMNKYNRQNENKAIDGYYYIISV